MKMKFWKWKNQTDSPTAPPQRTLFLNGTIAEESWFDDDITPQLFRDELFSGDGDVVVWINSPGGDCVAAAQIYNMLMDYHGNVTVKIDGIAASAASVIAMAGTTVLMSPVSMMMIHNPMTLAMGDKTDISELGAISTETPDIEIAQRDFELIDIPGKNGADYIDNGRYSNVEFSRSISLIGRKDFPVQDKAATFINAFAYLQGYQTFEDTDHNDMVTEAVLMNFNEINRKLRTLNTATLKFSRKPFWYLKSAMEYKDIDLTQTLATTSFDNPFPVDSKPIICITTTGGSPAFFQYRITTPDGQKNYDCANVSGGETLIIDCEKCIAKIGSNLAPFDIPEGFAIGRSTFQLISGANRIASVKIAPRWRCL